MRGRGIGHLLNARVEVWRAVLAEDGGGGQIETWEPQGTQPARLSQPSSAPRDAGDQLGAELVHVVYLRPSADVRRGDELRRAEQGLQVRAVFEPSVAGTYRRADCTSRQAEGGP